MYVHDIAGIVLSSLSMVTRLNHPETQIIIPIIQMRNSRHRKENGLDQ